MKLSRAMEKAIISYFQGRKWSHIHGRSMAGGAGQTWQALHRLGLISSDDELTERGRYEAACRLP